MATGLTSAVGKGKINANKEDNLAVQCLLNKFIIPGCLGSLKFLMCDGVIGSLTIAAIEKFQSVIMGFNYPDGHVDPGGQTWAALNGPLKWAKPSVTPAMTDDHKSQKWGLVLLKRNYTGTLWEFELLNVESKRAHRLVFNGAGKCNLEADLYSQEIAKWVESGKYSRFDWVPMAFKDFNRSASITPSTDTYGLRTCHALTLSDQPWAIKIRLPISHRTQNRGDQGGGELRGMVNEVHLHGSCKVEYGSGKPSKPEIWWK